jgi:hypothetical protein
MSVQLSLRKDYDNFSAFVTAAKKIYPANRVETAINTCTDIAWKVSKSIFKINPSAKFFAHLAEALEKTIISSR